MILPNFLNEFFSQKNPYEKIMDSINKIREEHKANNTLGFVSDKIEISKKDDDLSINHCLIMGNDQKMTMTYTLDVSCKDFLPSKIRKELETCSMAIIDQNLW